MTGRFSESYAAARELFVTTARRRGAALRHIVLDGHRGPADETLAIDVARLGSARPALHLLVLSGTHGVEGFAGSAIQTKLLDVALPDDVALTLVHAVNPYGFAWSTRANENNVDLNRNFLLPGAPIPVNAGYREIHDLLCVAHWTPEREAGVDAALSAYATRHGAQALTDAMIGGQYEYPDGLNFGGQVLQWSLSTLRAALDEPLASGAPSLLIDLHTGIAPWGEAAILSFEEQDTPRERLAARLFALPAHEGWHFGAPGLAKFTGLAVTGLMHHARHQRMLGAVVEFGTTDRPAIRRALRLDRYLRFAGDLDRARRDAFAREIREVFYPRDPAWRARCATLGAALFAHLLSAPTREKLNVSG